MTKKQLAEYLKEHKDKIIEAKTTEDCKTIYKLIIPKGTLIKFQYIIDLLPIRSGSIVNQYKYDLFVRWLTFLSDDYQGEFDVIMEEPVEKTITSNQLLESLKNTFDKCIETAKLKNHDYSFGDNPYKNFEMSELIGVSTPKGILVRIMDKISRIANLLETDASVKDEKITDTLEDLINYAAILKAYLEK